MTVQQQFPEILEVRHDRALRKIYLKEWLLYPFWFFRKAPLRLWWDFFGSTHRVAWGVAHAQSALRQQEDIWRRKALRSRLVKWAEEKLK